MALRDCRFFNRAFVLLIVIKNSNDVSTLQTITRTQIHTAFCKEKDLVPLACIPWTQADTAVCNNCYSESWNSGGASDSVLPLQSKKHFLKDSWDFQASGLSIIYWILCSMMWVRSAKWISRPAHSACQQTLLKSSHLPDNFSLNKLPARVGFVQVGFASLMQAGTWCLITTEMKCLHERRDHLESFIKSLVSFFGL